MSSIPRRRLGQRIHMEALERRQVMTGQLLLSAISPPPITDTNFATVSVIDVRDREVSPVFESSLLDTSATDSTEGVTGLAVDRQGRLIASVSQRGSSAIQHASDLPHASELLIREFPDAQPTERLPILLSGMPVGVADLAIDSTSNRLFAISSPNSVQLGPGQLLEIDISNGEASLIGSTVLEGNVSIAIDGDGKLLATSQAHGLAPLVLHEIDRDTGGVLESRIIVDTEPFALTTGLAVASDSDLIYGSESHSGRLFTIDPATGVRSILINQAPERGVVGDLAFYSRLGSDDSTQLFHADFETGSNGFSINNTGGDIVGMWHRSLGRRNDDMLNHSADHSFYYGQFEGSTGGGHYVQGTHHRGVISSPDVELPAEGTSILSFSYLLDTRPELNRDFVTVSIDNGTTVEPILSRIDGTLPETAGRWLTATYDLSAFAGQTVSVDFEFDSGDPVRVDPEGWYVDDVVIVHLNEPPPLQVDLSSAKDSDKEEVAPGELLTYTISVTNQMGSEADATNVMVSDTLPPEVTLVEAGTTPGFTIGTNGEVEFIIDQLPIGETRTFTIVTRVNDLTPETDIGGEVVVMSNSVVVVSDQPDPDPSDNTDTKDVDRITPERVDLLIEKSTTSVKAAPGDRLVYTIVATNLNDSNMSASNVVVTDTLPDNVTIVESETTPGFVRLPGNQIAWTIDVLPKGTLSEFTLVVDYDLVALDSVSDLVNTVTVISDQPDPVSNNNDDEVTTPVPTANLLVSKTVTNSNPLPGDIIEFTVRVTNQPDSRSDATGVIATDLLPDGLTAVDPSSDITVSAGSYDLSTGIWDGFDLPIGAFETLEIVARVDGNVQPSILTNTATAMSDDPDPDESNNVSSVTIVPTQTVQFVTPLSVFRATASVIPANSQIAASGFVWDDQNGDGLRDANEPGVDGVRLSFLREANPNQDGPVLFAGVQTRTIDVNGDGTIDPVTESGFWFLQKGSVPDGIYQVEVDRPDDVSVTSPAPEASEVEIIDAADAALLDFGLSRDFASTPSTDRGTISGFAWADVNQDGQWDVDETARTNASIFIDTDDDGIFDPQRDPSSLTDDLGRFVFADLAPGTYVIREFDVDQAFGSGNADRSTVFLQTSPTNASQDKSAFHTIELAGGSVVQGQAGTDDAPNFGVNEVARFVRPADQLEFWLDEYEALDDALLVYQSFSVSNTTDQPFSITDISEIELVDNSGDYVSVKQVDLDGKLIDPVFPIQLDIGSSTEFLVLYDPATRNAAGSVETQQPDWFGSNADRSEHTFQTSEHLTVLTDQDFEFRVQLLGGSTFDSDISYDGLVDNADNALLIDLLSREPTIVWGQSHRFDPTYDVNARDPNGAQNGLAPSTFQDGNIDREISLGDFGPINVELPNSERAPLPIRIPPA